jgi:hypothetical protein
VETGIHILHGLVLTGLGAFVWKSADSAGIRYLAMAVFFAALSPFCIAAAQIMDIPAAAFLRWIAVPAAYGYYICLIQSMILLFQKRTLAARLVLAVLCIFALLVTAYFYSDSYSREPVLNASGIFDFPPGAAAVAAGFAAFVYTLVLFLASFAPLLAWRKFRDGVLLLPAGLLIVASIVLRGILSVRTFAEEPHSIVLHGSVFLLSAGPLALYAALAIGLGRRFESTSGENASSE